MFTSLITKKTRAFNNLSIAYRIEKDFPIGNYSDQGSINFVIKKVFNICKILSFFSFFFYYIHINFCWVGRGNFRLAPGVWFGIRAET